MQPIKITTAMKALHQRLSFTNRIPTRSIPPETHASTARLSFGLARNRHRVAMRRTRLQPIGNGSGDWNLRALWVSIRCLLERGGSDRSTGSSKVLGHTSLPTMIARPPTEIWPPEKRSPSRARIGSGGFSRSESGSHLWQVLRSEVDRRGALWETAGFLAIWLSGLIAVAICFLS